MKKVLLPEAGNGMNYYRANLHCHTTVSDGKMTPEEIKAMYMSHGYSVVAYTDHNVLIPHDDLCDENFVALNSYELNINDPFKYNYPRSKTCHVNFIALEQDNITDVCYHRTAYAKGNAKLWRDKVKHDPDAPDYERVYSGDGVSDLIAKGRQAGFFVTYNHPTWSLESYPDYSNYRGMNAMEIVNYSCVVDGYEDDNGRVYDDLLNQGKHIYCIATDDNHNGHPQGDPQCDSFGGYTMIAAPRLEYREITKALEAGNFYAVQGTSTHKGPEILSIEYEDGKVFIRTSEARRINLITSARCKNRMKAAPDGETVNYAEYELKDSEVWFRVVVTDTEGYKAYTNAYFLKDLKEN